MTYTLAPFPALRGRLLLKVWATLILSTMVYCEFSQLAHDRTLSPDIGISLLWNLKVWALWVPLSLAFVTERGRLAVARLWQRPLLRIVALLLLPALSFECEWWIGRVFDDAGWLGQEASQADLLYRRLPLYAVALALLVFVARRLTPTVPSVTPRAASAPGRKWRPHSSSP